MTVYVVTGAASGIGKAIVDRFASEAGTVLALDITYDGISRKHTPSGEIVSVEFDVKSEQSWLRLVDTLLLEYGGLNVLLNNAALFSPSPTSEEDAAGFMKVVEVNQLATFLGMKAATLAMTDNGGSIINICSTGGIRGFEGAFSYSSTKWAIRGMTKVAVRELAPKKYG